MAVSCAPNDLMSGASCLTCLSPAQAQAVRVRLLCAIINGEMINCDPASLMASANCMMCLSPGQLQAVEIYLLCQIASSGTGGGSGGGVPCGTVDPVAAPTSGCLYMNQSAGSLWFWTGSAWQPLIAA